MSIVRSNAMVRGGTHRGLFFYCGHIPRRREHSEIVRDDDYSDTKY